VLLTKCCLVDQTKEGELGGACDECGGEENEYRVWWEDREERDYLEDLGVDGKALNWILKETVCDSLV
jgi:hypothetical protein